MNAFEQVARTIGKLVKERDQQLRGIFHRNDPTEEFAELNRELGKQLDLLKSYSETPEGTDLLLHKLSTGL